MNINRTNFPFGATIALLLSIITFKYEGESFNISLPGMAIGTIVMAIIGMILIYRIFDAVQAILIAKGMLQKPIHSKYDVLLPIGIIGMILQGQFLSSEYVTNMDGEFVPQWTLRLGEPTLWPYFAVGLITIVLLIRIRILLVTIALEADGA